MTPTNLAVGINKKNARKRNGRQKINAAASGLLALNFVVFLGKKVQK